MGFDDDIIESDDDKTSHFSLNEFYFSKINDMKK